jgi:hypothetical protein
LNIFLESLDTLAGVLLSPSSTLARITDRKPIALALLAAVSVAIVSGLVLVPNPPELVEDMLGMPKGTLSFRAILPLWVAVFMAILSLQAAFVHLAASVLKGRDGFARDGACSGDSPGAFRGIFCGLCFAYLPGLLAAPLIMLRALFASDRANAAYQVVFPLLCLWVFFLGVTAVRQNYRMTAARAAAVCSLAFAVLVVLPIVGAMVIMTQTMDS